MADEYTDRTEPGRASEQLEELELDELELDDKPTAGERLDWPPQAPERADPEGDAEPVRGPNRAGGNGRVDAPEEEALHPESDRTEE